MWRFENHCLLIFAFRQFSCRKSEHLEDFIVRNVHQFEGTFGVLLFLYSILLSKVILLYVYIITYYNFATVRSAHNVDAPARIYMVLHE